MHGRHAQEPPLAVIFLTVLVDLIGIGILIPVIQQLLADPESHSYLLGGQVTPRHGLLIFCLNVSLQSLANVVPPLLAGAIAARWSTTTPIAVGAAVCLCAWAAFGIMTRAARKA